MVIPAEVRRHFHVSAGTELEVVVKDLTVRLVPRVEGARLVKLGNRPVAQPVTPSEDLPEVDVYIAQIATRAGSRTFVTDNLRHFRGLTRHAIRLMGARSSSPSPVYETLFLHRGMTSLARSF